MNSVYLIKRDPSASGVKQFFMNSTSLLQSILIPCLDDLNPLIGHWVEGVSIKIANNADKRDFIQPYKPECGIGNLPMSSPLGSYNNVNMAAWQMQSQNSQLQQLQQGFTNPGDEDHKKLKKSAQEFESVFIQQMIEQMDKTVDRENSMMGGGSAEGYWRGMLNEQFAKGMANQPGGSGLGLAESIYQQMSAQMTADSSKTAAAPPAQTAAMSLAPKMPAIKSLTPDVVNTLLAPKIRKL